MTDAIERAAREAAEEMFSPTGRFMVPLHTWGQAERDMAAAVITRHVYAEIKASNRTLYIEGCNE